MHKTCPICKQQFSDTTTCPHCLAAFLDDIATHQKELVESGLSGISLKEWGWFIVDGDLRQSGKISQTELNRRKKENVKKVKERLEKKAQNEARLKAQDVLSRSRAAYL